MVSQGKTADYEGFGKDVKRGLSKEDLIKKYKLKTRSAYKQYLYMARTLGILEKGELPGKPLKPSEPVKPFEPSEPKWQDKLKVHWELPRELVARIRYMATVDGKAVIDLVREALENHTKKA